MTDQIITIGSPHYFMFLGLLWASRGTDFLSTWLATPSLQLEANPIARKLGWKWGIVVNLAVCSVLACWPLPTIMVITTSLLVAARNFQSAWLMRTLGETQYRSWIAERLAESNRVVFVFCIMAQSLLTAAVGGVLILSSHGGLVPFAVGAGMVTYAVAVTCFSLLSGWRVWRQPG
jgi:hypothetical protein